jgi:hypothetical protein
MLIDPNRQRGQMLGRTLDPLDAQDGGPVASAFGFSALDIKSTKINSDLAAKIAQSSPARFRQGAGALPKTQPPTPADGGRFIKSPAGPRTSLPGNGATATAPAKGRPGMTMPGTWTPGVQLPMLPIAAPGSTDVATAPADAAEKSNASTFAIAIAIVAVAWFASR